MWGVAFTCGRYMSPPAPRSRLCARPRLIPCGACRVDARALHAACVRPHLPHRHASTPPAPLRDIKPQNVLVSGQQLSVKLSDFGLARHYMPFGQQYTSKVWGWWTTWGPAGVEAVSWRDTTCLLGSSTPARCGEGVNRRRSAGLQSVDGLLNKALHAFCLADHWQHVYVKGKSGRACSGGCSPACQSWRCLSRRSCSSLPPSTPHLLLPPRSVRPLSLRLCLRLSLRSSSPLCLGLPLASASPISQPLAPSLCLRLAIAFALPPPPSASPPYGPMCLPFASVLSLPSLCLRLPPPLRPYGPMCLRFASALPLPLLCLRLPQPLCPYGPMCLRFASASLSLSSLLGHLASF
eukprot:361744-Chlamydomonas_euryale.AAC.1